MEIRQRLFEAAGEENVLLCEPMDRHTTFRVGGPAAYFVSPDTQHLPAVLEVCRSEGLKYFVLGRGSNLLVSDSGYDGVVISLRKYFGGLTIEEDTGVLTAGAGALLSAAGAAALEAGLGGLEFASGIPGTIGGGIWMNAGAYGGELGPLALDVRVLTPEGVRTLPGGECGFGYRSSRFQREGQIILGCRLQLRPKEKEAIRAEMEDYARRRREKQPLEFGSAGSTFRRPPGHFAGKLIEDAGLKGLSIGGAQVSEKHAGFIINTGEATALDIYRLIRKVQHEVESRTGIRLETEVKFAGSFPEEEDAAGRRSRETDPPMQL